MATKQNRDRNPITAQEVRQGRIVLNTPLRRAVFLGALAAAVVVGIAGLFVAAATA